MLLPLIKRYWKLLATLAVLLFVFCAGRGCRRKRPTSAVTPVAETLKTGEKQKISVDTRSGRVTVVRPEGTEKLEGVRNVSIIEKTNGQVNILAPTHGFTFEPGLSAFGTSGGVGVGIDATLFYWRRFDFLVGVGGTKLGLNGVVGYTAIGYTPTVELLSNTDFFVGIGTNRSIVAGIRLEF